MNKDFINGYIGGVMGVGLSHPFDTVRVRIQTNPTEFPNIRVCVRKSYISGCIKSFYRGFLPPLFGIGLEKSLVFGFYNTLLNKNLFENKYKNIFVSGLGSGLICTSIVTPLERIKINLQYVKTGSKKYNNSLEAVTNIVRRQGVRSLYNGWSATLFREVPGYGIYFSTYEYLKDHVKYDNPITTLLLGGLSGSMSWLFIYPSDVVKSNMQMKELSLKKTCLDIYQKRGIAGFYKGFSLGIFRAFPLHGGVFLGYELSKKFI